MQGRELQNRTWWTGKRPPSHKHCSSQHFSSLNPRPSSARVMEKSEWQCWS